MPPNNLHSFAIITYRQIVGPVVEVAVAFVFSPRVHGFDPAGIVDEDIVPEHEVLVVEIVPEHHVLGIRAPCGLHGTGKIATMIAGCARATNI